MVRQSRAPTSSATRLSARTEVPIVSVESDEHMRASSSTLRSLSPIRTARQPAPHPVSTVSVEPDEHPLASSSTLRTLSPMRAVSPTRVPSSPSRRFASPSRVVRELERGRSAYNLRATLSPHNALRISAPSLPTTPQQTSKSTSSFAPAQLRTSASRLFTPRQSLRSQPQSGASPNALDTSGSIRSAVDLGHSGTKARVMERVSSLHVPIAKMPETPAMQSRAWHGFAEEGNPVYPHILGSGSARGQQRCGTARTTGYVPGALSNLVAKTLAGEISDGHREPDDVAETRKSSESSDITCRSRVGSGAFAESGAGQTATQRFSGVQSPYPGDISRHRSTLPGSNANIVGVYEAIKGAYEALLQNKDTDMSESQKSHVKDRFQGAEAAGYDQSKIQDQQLTWPLPAGSGYPQTNPDMNMAIQPRPSNGTSHGSTEEVVLESVECPSHEPLSSSLIDKEAHQRFARHGKVDMANSPSKVHEKSFARDDRVANGADDGADDVCLSEPMSEPMEKDCADSQGPESIPKVTSKTHPKLVIFDFDCTLTVSDVFASLSGVEPTATPVPAPHARTECGQLSRLLELDSEKGPGHFAKGVFGGVGRVITLTCFLIQLRKANIEAIICSRCLHGPMRRCLQQVGLLEFFKMVFGATGDAYSQVQGALDYDCSLPSDSCCKLALGTEDVNFPLSKSKADFVNECIQTRGLRSSEVVFVDDDASVIDELQGICWAIHVQQGKGIGEVELSILRGMLF